MRLNELKALFACLLFICSISATKRDVAIYGKKQVGRDVLSNLLGEWISIKDFTMPITGLDDDEIRNLMSINCRFEDNICIIFKDTIHNPHYTLNRVGASQYFLNNYPRIPKGFVGIKKDSIDVITVNGGKIVDAYDVIDLNGEILIFFEGVFFQYQRPESLEKSNPILIREFNFQGNTAALKDPLKMVDSLREIANSLKNNKRLFVVIQGNTDNIGMEAKTTIDSKDGSIKDLLIARAQSVSQILITQFKVNPSQVRVNIGKINYKPSATLLLFRR